MKKFKRYFYITLGMIFIFTISTPLEINRRIANDLAKWADRKEIDFINKVNKHLAEKGLLGK